MRIQNNKPFALIIVVSLMMTLLTGCACEHQWHEATCSSPKTCEKCGEISDDVLSHNFLNGYCEKCGTKDPTFVDLNELGFSNNYGMNIWLDIVGYDYSNNRVKASGLYFTIYNGNYRQYGWIKAENINQNSDIHIEKFGSVQTEAYTILSNDVIQYNGATGWGPVTIVERVVDSENKKLVIKAQDETSLSGSRDEWYVPIDLLDFSTVIEEDNYYYINFK